MTTTEPKTIVFNTGRHYTVNGQRIIATLHDDGVITFHDIDRMIDGELSGTHPVISDYRVLAAYDRCDYAASERSMNDSARAGGVNRKSLCLELLKDPTRPTQIALRRPEPPREETPPATGRVELSAADIARHIRNLTREKVRLIARIEATKRKRSWRQSEIAMTVSDLTSRLETIQAAIVLFSELDQGTIAAAS